MIHHETFLGVVYGWDSGDGFREWVRFRKRKDMMRNKTELIRDKTRKDLVFH